MLKPNLTIFLTALVLLPLVVACSSSAPPPPATPGTSPAASASPSPSSAATTQNSPLNPILVPIQRAKDAANTVEESGKKTDEENKAN